MKCADCLCIPELCSKVNYEDCKICIKDDCCCVEIHLKEKQTTLRFFWNVRNLYASALGIEILCILSAEIGMNSSFFLFGYKTPFEIAIAYVLGYGLAGFTTFATILGRYNYGSNDKIDSCCSVFEQGAGSGFASNLKTTFRNFAIGIRKLPKLHRQPNLKYILKTSAYILVTAESVCILTAETVDLIFYQYSILLAVPLGLLAGAFTIVVPEAYRKVHQKNFQSLT